MKLSDSMVHLNFIVTLVKKKYFTSLDLIFYTVATLTRAKTDEKQ